jgi:hypothetical protein
LLAAGLAGLALAAASGHAGLAVRGLSAGGVAGLFLELWPRPRPKRAAATSPSAPGHAGPSLLR